jgi:hypothetical protein
MREIRTSGSMSGERKRNDGCTAPKSPRLSSTLLELLRAFTPVFAGYARSNTPAAARIVESREELDPTYVSPGALGGARMSSR